MLQLRYINKDCTFCKVLGDANGISKFKALEDRHNGDVDLLCHNIYDSLSVARLIAQKLELYNYLLNKVVPSGYPW